MKDDIKWHPAFAAAIQLELKEYSNHLEFITEHELTQEPLRIDVVMIKKLDDVVIEKSIGKIFKTYNIFEYKSPKDYISIDDFYKVMGYAYFYKALEGKTNSIHINDMTVTLTSTGRPDKLIKYLKEMGMEVTQQIPGLYYIENNTIDTQLIVTRELCDNESIYLQMLQNEYRNKNTLKSWITEYIYNNKNPLYKVLMDVIEKNNPNEIMEVYKSMGMARLTDENMEFLIEAMKHFEIDKKFKAEGEIEGERKGELRGQIKGKAKLVIKQLTKKFKNVPEEYKEKIMNLSDETLDVIGLEIFDLKSVHELKQYFD